MYASEGTHDSVRLSVTHDGSRSPASTTTAHAPFVRDPPGHAQRSDRTAGSYGEPWLTLSGSNAPAAA